MIWIDNRIGSSELAIYFPPSSVALTRLEYGDFAFIGNGPDDTPYFIGIERKTIRDMISSMTTGRLSGHQLIGLTNAYNIVYIIIEGYYRPSAKTGLLEIRSGGRWSPLQFGKRTFMMTELWGHLNTLTEKLGVRIIETATPTETVQRIRSLQRWWENKPFDDHCSHIQFNKSNIVSMFKQPLLRRVVAQFRGVGWGRARAIAQYYTSLWELSNTSSEELMQIEGIGKKLAFSIMEEIHDLR